MELNDAVNETSSINTCTIYFTCMNTATLIGVFYGISELCHIKLYVYYKYYLNKRNLK